MIIVIMEREKIKKYATEYLQEKLLRRKAVYELR
jgi:hypothetical protein